MIRPARDGDADRLAEIHVAAWRGGCRGLLPAEVLAGVSVERRARDWTRWLAAPGAWTYHCERDGRLVGFVTLATLRANGRPSRSLIELRRLYVDPGQWRAGVGRALHARALEVARAGGFTQLVLWVLSGNLRARAFYAALGYEPDRTRRVDIGGHAADETRYRLDLGSS